MAPRALSAVPVGESSHPTDEVKPYSCVTCYDRKVKCDRTVPCSNCQKASSECVYRPPPPPKRGKRKRLDEEDVHMKCKRYEELLLQAGILIDTPAQGLVKSRPASKEHSSSNAEQRNPVNDQNVTPKSAVRVNGFLTGCGTLVLRKRNGKADGSTRYVASTLWTTVADHFNDLDEIFGASDEEQDEEEEVQQFAGTSIDNNGSGLLLNLPFLITRADMVRFHPLPDHVEILWQCYQENINPLIKVTHAPSMKELLYIAKTNPASLSRSQEALLLAIYLAAVNSMTEEECENQFGDNRTNLLNRYQLATQHALARAKFLSSPEIMTLTGFLIFLLSMRQRYDQSTIWALAGVAVRIGRRFGLHRDGKELNISPFQTQMRRLLWWQLIVLDGRSAELAGGNSAFAEGKFDIGLPLNINDEDISPDMKEFPAERTGATEMLNVRVRLEMALFRYKFNLMSPSDVTGKQNIDEYIKKCDIAIDEFERQLENDKMRFIQPYIAAHFMASIIIRTGISTIRVLAHHPRQRPDKGANMPQAERDMVFVNSLNSIEGDTLIQKTPLLRRFVWHAQNYLQWSAFIYVLGELRVRIDGEEVERAWRLIEEVFEQKTELFSDPRKEFYKAITNLTLKVWLEREQKLATKTGSAPSNNHPRFIKDLRSRRERSSSRRHSTQADPKAALTSSAASPNYFDSYDKVVALSQDLDSSEYFNPSDWAEWDRLLQESMTEPFVPIDIGQNMNNSNV